MIYLRLFLLGLLICPPFAASHAATTPKPNFIVIVADDLGWGDLSSYGQRVVQTPTIDRLAKDGMRFTSFYAGSSVCIPSRCALMTGLHTGHCRMRGQSPYIPLRESDRTIAARLKERGYATGMVGKWALGSLKGSGSPLRQGFDYFFGFADQVRAHNYYPSWVWENDRRFEIPGNVERDGIAIKKSTYINDLFVEKATEFIRRNADRPFFLYLPLTLPHVNNELDAATGNGMEVPAINVELGPGYSERERARAQMIVEMDNSVARILQALATARVSDRTMILFTSDNGASGADDPRGVFNANGGLRGDKAQLYEGGIRVPLIVWGPSRVRSGVVVQKPWAAWDLLPTIAELAGADSSGSDGTSFGAVLETGTAPVVDRTFYWELHQAHVEQAVRWGEWKAVRQGGPGAPIELYDLASDPVERVDLAGARTDIVAKARQLLEDSRTASADWPLVETAVPGKPGMIVYVLSWLMSWPAKIENWFLPPFREDLTPILPRGKPIKLIELGPPSPDLLAHLSRWSGETPGRISLYALAKPRDDGVAVEAELFQILGREFAEADASIVFSRAAGRGRTKEVIEQMIEGLGGELENINTYRSGAQTVVLMRLKNPATFAETLQAPFQRLFEQSRVAGSMTIKSAGLNVWDVRKIEEQGFTQVWIKIKAPKKTYRVMVNGTALNARIGDDLMTATIPYKLFESNHSIDLTVWDIQARERSREWVYRLPPRFERPTSR
jgi:arylsulfatase A-like enzyme